MTVVNKAKTTGKRVKTFNSACTLGLLLGCPCGKALYKATIVTMPNTAMMAKALRQPMVCPIHVASGTPPILAMVKPMNMLATALACLSFGTKPAATTEPMPKKAP